MNSWQIVRLVAGTFILLSLALGTPGSPFFLSLWWLAFTAFVGANLLQSALTRWCHHPVGLMLEDVAVVHERRGDGRLSELDQQLHRLLDHQISVSPSRTRA